MDLNYKLLHENWLAEGRPLLVFLHEGLGSIGQWKDFPHLLSEKTALPALLYDRYGYGKSPDRMQPFESDFLHKEAWEVFPQLIEHHHITNPLIIFGHSDGATLALLHASKATHNVLGYMVEAPHVILEELSFNGLRTARSILKDPSLLERLSHYQGKRTISLVEEWTSFWLSQEGSDWDIAEELERIVHPLCLIQGEDDHFGTYKQLDTIVDKVQSQKIEVHMLKDCGHIPHLQKKEEVLKIADHFIRSLLQE